MKEEEKKIVSLVIEQNLDVHWKVLNTNLLL